MVHVLKPEHRFNAIEVRSRYRLYPEVSYSCGHCEALLAFRPRDFKRHCGTDSSNLAQDVSVRMVEAARQAGVESDSFLDFYCPACKLAVRVLYDCREQLMGGPPGTFAFRLRAVLESSS